ncbi:MAG: succinyl-diaminopimelate desuccinylase [Betaproteobacteria bacterium RIFCSPLOWO2_12_FULL_63_13]|nr:MAG: succinyl-diaminopimelate desuccinylase [Betaproteobacteria bacterium RIFCSPLOWO2_12_FULL_63_13]
MAGPRADSATLRLARELILRRSITPDDAGCQELLAARLDPVGFAVERIPCGEVSNLWVRRGRGAPLVCFAGHTDVVPTGPLDQWLSDPFVPTERDGALYGRGAADMKSSIAAFVTAAESFLTRYPGHRGSIAMLITSDEEGVALDGTVRVIERLKQRGERIDYALVGEPTSELRFGDTVKNGRRGSLSARLRIRGVQGHVAYPQHARNPVHLGAPALAELAGIEWDRGNEYFPSTTWQVSNVHAGTGAANVIPGEVEVLCNFRFGTASSVDELKRRMHSVLDRHGLDYSIDWTLSAVSFLTPPGDLVDKFSTAIQEVIGIRPDVSTTGGTSDGRFIAEICDQIVEFGPVNASIHKLNEHIRIDDIDALHAVYLRALEKLLVI